MVDLKVLQKLRNLLQVEIPRIVQYVAGVSDEAIDSESILNEEDAKVEAEKKLQKIVSTERNKNLLGVLIFLVVIVLILCAVIGVIVLDKEGVVLAHVNHGFVAVSGVFAATGKLLREFMQDILGAVSVSSNNERRVGIENNDANEL